MNEPPPPPPSSPDPPAPPPDGLTPPPGYVPYGTLPTPLVPIKRVRGISRAIVILTGIAGVAAAIGGVLTPAVADKAGDYVDGRISEDEFLESFGPLALTQFLWFGATIAAGVTTIIWMYRISANVRAYGRATFWAPLWAVFGWVLPPLVLYVIPFLMLRELWKASTSEPVDDPEGWKRQPDNPMLWAWWFLYGLIPLVFLVIQFDSQVGGGVGSGDTLTAAENIEGSGTIGLVSSFVLLGAAITWILFVRQLTRRHTALTSEN